MIAPALARSAYIVPAMINIQRYSLNAERLLMGTAAIESNFVNFVQFSGGPARGLFQMEQITYSDIVDRYLSISTQHALRNAAFSMALASPPTFIELSVNHLFAAALARIKYAMIPVPIPGTLAGHAAYWSKYYNGQSPNGLSPDDYLSRWQTYCAPLYPDFQ
ncbi:MAG: hypothetical protein B7Z75_11890 [Acidocella sp. 20-57-95]|nr:MAG: hypothetical protein B7Z75_11890 [Acidocella sp. 20-57-95]HQT63168.1 hypothetical protein [Acidocella sp.]HQU03312.1 hypothetical protein [Acidocella sp.]